MKARDVMTAPETVVVGSDSLTWAVAVMRDAELDVLPVVWSRDDMRLRGLLRAQDVEGHGAAQHADDRAVTDAMTVQPIATVAPVADVHVIARLVDRHMLTRIPVTDDAGRVLGIVERSRLDAAQRDPDSTLPANR